MLYTISTGGICLRKLIVLLLSVGLLAACGNEETEEEMNEGQNQETSEQETKPVKEPQVEPEPVEVTRQDEIESLVRDKIKEDYDSTSINQLAVNKDMGKGEGYIVLAHLSFDRKNRAKTAKEMISMYAQDLGASLADQKDINEVTVFFEVPYLKEGDNIYKLNMQRQGDGMAIKDEFVDQSIF